MHFFFFLSDALGIKRGPANISDPILCAGEKTRRLMIQAYALELCIDFVARMVAASSIVTKINGKSVEEKMYYRLNIEPNPNQTASEFWKKVVYKMILDGEALVIQHEQPGRNPDAYLVVDEYDKIERAMVENRYKNLKIGDYELNKAGYKNVFSESDVWVFRYDNSKLREHTAKFTKGLEAILDVVQAQYVKKKFTKSVIEVQGMQGLGREQTDERQNLYDRNMRDFLQAEKDAILPLSNNQKIGRFESVMGDGVIDDAQNIKMFTELAIQLNAAMFNIPVQALYGETVDLTGWFTSFLKPFTEGMAREINRKSYRMTRMQSNTYCYFDLSNLIPQTKLDRARMLDLLLRSGTHTINENRNEMGLEPINEDWADQFWMTLNYDFVARFIEGTQGSRGDPGEDDAHEDEQEDEDEEEGTEVSAVE